MARAAWAGLGLAVLTATFGTMGCSQVDDPWMKVAGAPRVVVTIAPLYSFVKGVAGDRAAVICLCQDKGPHGYEFDAHDAVLLQRADLFLAVGLTLDNHFADKMATQSHRAGLRYVRVGKELSPKQLIQLSEPVRHGDHVHEAGPDPHVWLGIDEAVGMVGVVRDQLAKADPTNAEQYRNNAEAYIGKLEQVKADGKKLLEGKKHRRIITFHDSLRYFERCFGVKVAGVIQVTPNQAPAGGELANLVEMCARAEKEGDPIRVIAVEPQYKETSSAKTLQSELRRRKVTVNLVEIDPLETASPAELAKLGADWYPTQMRKNLEALAKELP